MTTIGVITEPIKKIHVEWKTRMMRTQASTFPRQVNSTDDSTRLDSRRQKLGLHSKLRVPLINQLILMEMAPIHTHTCGLLRAV